MKICIKCKIEKDESEFSKCKREKDGLQYTCKECANKYSKEYKKENPEKISKRNKKYNEKNKKQILKNQKIYCKENSKRILEYKKQYRKENKEKIVEYRYKYYKSKTKYDTYAHQISYADEVKNVDEYLQTKCAYCGKWYFPVASSVKDRIYALNSNDGRESRLYCSDECKEVCPIYNQILWPKRYKQSYSREVQPELRQMVFERDEYTCIKCGKHQDELDVPLHCHHIEGIKHNPIESADIDICVTVCKECHNKIHQQKDCGYNDMRCKTGEENR